MRVRIQVRLTALYAALLAATLVALGFFLVVVLRQDLYSDVDQETRESSSVIAEAIADGSEGSADDGTGGESTGTRTRDLADDFEDSADAVLPDSEAAAQVLAPGGRVLLHHGTLPATTSLIGPAALRAASGASPRPVTVRLGEDRQRYRVLVTALPGPGPQRTLVVAVSLRRAEDDVHMVLMLLLLAGPVGLLVTALAGFWVARRALRPVDRMISDAEAVRTDRLHERVAVPAARDELRHLAETLNAMLDRIEDGVKQQRRLVADASHELRTPLAVMRSELDVSLRADELSPAARELLISTRDEVDRMSRTVDNLLTLAAVDEGRLELLTERLDLREAADQAVASLRHLAAAKDIRVEVTGGHWEVRADRQRMSLALGNLVGNAVKFTPRGGTVRVATWSRDAETGVTVADDGPGVAEADLPHLFDRFYRADSARAGQTGGSGLGLAICQEVARAHGGRVRVESELGVGSRFLLALPAWRALPTEDEPASTLAGAHAGPGEGTTPYAEGTERGRQKRR